MFNRDGIFGKKEDNPLADRRSSVSGVPVLGVPPVRPPQETAPAEKQPQDAPKPAATVEAAKGSKLIVGPNIKLKGVQITDCDTLVVEGRVEASMDSRVISIAERGVFAGTVGIDVAEIHGRFEGELTARKQLVIYATGNVSGKIRYGKITIEEGGQLTGDVSALQAAAIASTPAAVQPETILPEILPSYDSVARAKARALQTAKAP